MEAAILPRAQPQRQAVNGKPRRGGSRGVYSVSMYLVWDSPQGQVVHSLARAITIIGRDRVSDLCVEDETVAKRHAMVQVANGHVTITDLRSPSGTRINGAALVPEVPSTLEPGDFINVGGVVLGFHKTPPPALKRAGPPPKKPRAQSVAAYRAHPVPRKVGPSGPAESAAPHAWKWIAMALGFLLVGCVGALVAVLAVRGDDETGKQGAEKAAETPKSAGAKKPPVQAQVETLPPKPEPKPEPKKKKAIEGLPKAVWAPPKDCPDLVETTERFIPVKVLDWGAQWMEVIGPDGERYRFKASLVVRVADRLDLARRAQRQIAKVSIEDAAACSTLAKWCFQRHVRGPLEPFLMRILNQRPNDPLKVLFDAIKADQ